MALVTIRTRKQGKQYIGMAINVENNQPVFEGPPAKTIAKAVRSVHNALRNTSHQLALETETG